ncbi:uncharacterized protein [Procambarus clarkii]|uniref:uncharacterized protein isoform X2 n=1 Tax=Procambarus clarkii TaxID=6728 RepID=UPI003741ED01
MVSRVQQGSGSFTWFLVVAVSLVLVARVQPYPGYGERLRSARRYHAQQQQQQQQQALADTTSHDDYLDDPDDADDLDYSQLYEYNTLLPKREPEFYSFDQAEDSTKNLQQILRSFRPVVGGTTPSDRVMPWREMEEATMEDSSRGRLDPVDRVPSSGARLTQLTFSEPKQKREAIWPCVLWVKFCPLG